MKSIQRILIIVWGLSFLACTQDYRIPIYKPATYKTIALSNSFDLNLSYFSGVWVVTKPPSNKDAGGACNHYSYGTDSVLGDMLQVYLVDPNKDPEKGENPLQRTLYFDQKGTGLGARTYVTEAGMFFSRSPATLYRADPEMENEPSNPIQPVWSVNLTTGITIGTVTIKPLSSGRSCVASFKVGNQPYVGIAWTTNGYDRVFTRIPIDSAQPEKINTSLQSSVLLPRVTISPEGWGYSCFIDQKTNVFWSTWYPYNKVHGIDVETLSPVEITAAMPSAKKPNNFFPDPGLISGAVNNPIIQFSALMQDFGSFAMNTALSPQPLDAYTMSGDNHGNLFAGAASYAGTYTYVHEQRSDTVMWAIGTSLHIAKSACFSVPSMDCRQGGANHIVVSMPGSGNSGNAALSSLQDGSVIRLLFSYNCHAGTLNPPTSYTEMFRILIKNADEIRRNNAALNAAHVEVKQIMDGNISTQPLRLNGVAYQYTDFTGATLYSRDSNTKMIDLKALPFYRESGSNQRISISWTPLSGTGGESLENLLLEARCLGSIMSNEDRAKIPFELLPATMVSGEEFTLTSKSCRYPASFDQLEVRVTVIARNNYFSKIKGIGVSLYQSYLESEAVTIYK